MGFDLGSPVGGEGLMSDRTQGEVVRGSVMLQRAYDVCDVWRIMARDPQNLLVMRSCRQCVSTGCMLAARSVLILTLPMALDCSF